MIKKFLFAALFCISQTLTVMAQDPYAALGQFTFAALNVDGLPPSLKVIGVIDVNLNPDSKEGPGANAIGKKVAELGWDVLGVSEDFNYNTELMAPLTEAGYSAGTYRGNIVADFAAHAKIIAMQPITDTDGLNLIWKPGISVGYEKFIKWNSHHGYTNDGADGLINKGFRSYVVRLADGVYVEVYILHMDAEVTEGDLKARDEQLAQLVSTIKSSKTKYPKVVMGDTNCRYTRDYVKEHFIDAINADERFTIADGWIEKCKGGIYPEYGSDALMVGDLGYVEGEIVDKLFYINTTESPYRLVLDEFKIDTDFNNEDGEPLADHYPAVGTFSIKKTGYSPSATESLRWQNSTIVNDGSVEYYIYNPESGMFLNDDNTLSNEPHTKWVVDGNSIKSDNGKYISVTSKQSGLNVNVSASTNAGNSSLSAIESMFDCYRIGNKVKVSLTNERTRFITYKDGKLQTIEKNSDDTIAEEAKWIFVTMDKYNTATGITTLSEPMSSSAAYTLYGIRATDSTKGIIIVNGKKMLKR